jgi:hypothetical protein
MRAALNLLPTWALGHLSAVDDQVIAVLRTPLVAGEG